MSIANFFYPPLFCGLLECVCFKSANVPTRWSADVGFQGEVVQSYGCQKKTARRIHWAASQHTVKIVYGLPKVINLPSRWKLIGLNLLEGPCSQSVSPRCADTEISGCSSGAAWYPQCPSPTRPDGLAPPRQWTAWWLRSVITFFCFSECLSFTVRGRRRGGGAVPEWRRSELESHSDLLTETPEHSKSFSWLGFHLCVRGRGCNTCSHGHLTFLSRSTQMRLVRPLHASGSAGQHTK